MRILMISNLYPPQILGGYEILCAQVTESLRARGHEVAVLTSRQNAGAADPDPLVFRELDLEVPFSRSFRSSRIRRARVGAINARRTAKRIERFGPDLVFLWSLRRLTLGPARAAETRDLPVAWTLNDEYLSGFRRVKATRSPRRLLGAISDSSWMRKETVDALKLEHATAISRCLRSRLVKAGVPVENAKVVYQGPPLDRFPCRTRPISAVRRCLYVGQLHPDKGVHIAIQAVHRLAETHPGLSLSIVGRGDEGYTRRLRRLAREGQAEVTFVGAKPHRDVPRIYRRHDVLLFPSIWSEPFGLTHLEAMASGLPVISTGHGGQGEVLEDGHSALLVAAADAAAMARALRSLVESPARARALAESGRRLVEERLNLETYVDQLETWLEGIGQDIQGGRAA
ncbi:MAG: glycosyltransferase family 4 protein [Thermoanaerobaculia bacterium]|nr:glycosyltransferase family 4 protein [Thermoanaerobaculia bacterium]